jgi:hypothetical protein
MSRIESFVSEHQSRMVDYFGILLAFGVAGAMLSAPAWLGYFVTVY